MSEAQAEPVQEKKDIKIGELLTAVGVVSSGDLQEAIQIAKRMNMPIGRVIVMSGVITEENLQFSIEAQSLIRDGLLDIDTAVTALKGAYKNNQTLQEALAALRWAPKQDVSTNKLGELLIDSMMVSQSQLDMALNASFESGMPLGGTLVLQGVLSAQLLPMVLNAQEKIRDGQISRDAAIENLKSAVMFWAQANAKDIEDQQRGRRSYNRLQPFDHSGQASGPAQGRAVAATGGEVKPQAKPPQRFVPPPASAPGGAEMTLMEMMKLSGYCTDSDIRDAVASALANSDITAKLFLATGLLKQAALDNFARCRSLIRRGAVTNDQALQALSTAHAHGISLDEAFEDMGLSVPKAGGGW